MQSECTKYGNVVDYWDTGKPAFGQNGTQFEEFAFRDRIVSIVNKHDFSQDLFLLYTPHVAHCPLVSWRPGAAMAILGEQPDPCRAAFARRCSKVAKLLRVVSRPGARARPQQVPRTYLDAFDFMTDDEGACSAQTPYIFPGSRASDFKCRQQYHSMVNLLDDNLRNITDSLKRRGVWNETLMVFSSDNGEQLATLPWALWSCLVATHCKTPPV